MKVLNIEHHKQDMDTFQAKEYRPVYKRSRKFRTLVKLCIQNPNPCLYGLWLGSTLTHKNAKPNFLTVLKRFWFTNGSLTTYYRTLTLSHSMLFAVSCLLNCSLLESNFTQSSLTDAKSDRIKAFSSNSCLSCSSNLDIVLVMDDI